jgi:hypothetical protein
MKQDEIMQNFVIMLSDKKLDTVKNFRKPGKIAIIKKHDKMYIPEKRKKLVGCDFDLEATVKLVIAGNISNSEMHTQTNIHSKELQKKQDTLRLLEEQRSSGVSDESTDILINRLNVEISAILDVQVEHFDITFYRSVCKKVLEGLSDRDRGWPYYNKLQIVYDNFREKSKPIKYVKPSANNTDKSHTDNWRTNNTDTCVTRNDVYVPPCARKNNHYSENNNRRDYKKSEGGDYKRSDSSNYRRSEGGDYRRSDSSNYRRSDGGDYRRSEGCDYRRSEGGDYKRNEGGDYRRSEGRDYKRNEGGDYRRSEGRDYKRNEGGYNRGDYRKNGANYNKPEDRSQNMELRRVVCDTLNEESAHSDGFQSLSQIIKMKELNSQESFPSMGNKNDSVSGKKTVWNTGNTINIIKETVKKPEQVKVEQVELEPVGLTKNKEYCRDTEKPAQVYTDNEWEQYIDCDTTNTDNKIKGLTDSWDDED